MQLLHVHGSVVIEVQPNHSNFNPASSTTGSEMYNHRDYNSLPVLLSGSSPPLSKIAKKDICLHALI